MLPFSHGLFGGCPETCCPNKAWQSQLYFPVKRILPAGFCLRVAHNGFCLTSFADFFKKLYLVLISHWLGTNPFEKGFLFLTRMKNVLSGKNTSQSLCFPFGLTWYFYPDGAASGNLWHTSVLHLFLFVPLGMDNYSFSKIHNTRHIFDESRAFVWKVANILSSKSVDVLCLGGCRRDLSWQSNRCARAPLKTSSAPRPWKPFLYKLVSSSRWK